MKVCTRCGESKPLEAFHRDGTKSDGHRAMYYVCVRTARNARDGARIASEHRERSARSRAYQFWRFDYRGRLDFEAWWARQRDR